MKTAILTMLFPLATLFYADRGHVQDTILFFPCGGTYLAGDCNQNGTPLELDDVVRMIGQYRGADPSSITCECPPHSDEFVPTSDPDGSCVAFELSDVVAIIAAYRGVIDPLGCPDCPPMD